MELDAEDISFFDGGGERSAVIGDSNIPWRARRAIRVAEINGLGGRDVAQEFRVTLELQLVPANMRTFRVFGKALANVFKPSSACNALSFLAAGKHPLHADADPEKGHAGCDTVEHGISQAASNERSGRSKISDPRQKQFPCRADYFSIAGDGAVCAQVFQCALD